MSSFYAKTNKNILNKNQISANYFENNINGLNFNENELNKIKIQDADFNNNLPEETNKTDKLRNCVNQCISDKSKKKISNIIDNVTELSDIEKVYLYLNLPTGSTNETECYKIKGAGNPFGKKADAEISQTYTWIQSHLEEDSTVSLPKHEVYEEYKIFCESNNLEPLCVADFGKAMKHMFPNVKPRRLGQRGNSRYCYSGLRKKIYFEKPELPDIYKDKNEDISNKIKNEKNGNEEKVLKHQLNENLTINDKSLILSASSHIVLEWARKFFNFKLSSIKDLAKYLIHQNHIDKESMAALTVISSEDVIEKEEFNFKTDQKNFENFKNCFNNSLVKQENIKKNFHEIKKESSSKKKDQVKVNVKSSESLKKNSKHVNKMKKSKKNKMDSINLQIDKKKCKVELIETETSFQENSKNNFDKEKTELSTNLVDINKTETTFIQPNDAMKNDYQYLENNTQSTYNLKRRHSTNGFITYFDKLNQTDTQNSLSITDDSNFRYQIKRPTNNLDFNSKKRALINKNSDLVQKNIYIKNQTNEFNDGFKKNFSFDVFLNQNDLKVHNSNFVSNSDTIKDHFDFKTNQNIYKKYYEINKDINQNDLKTNLENFKINDKISFVNNNQTSSMTIMPISIDSTLNQNLPINDSDIYQLNNLFEETNLTNLNNFNNQNIQNQNLASQSLTSQNINNQSLSSQSINNQSLTPQNINNQSLSTQSINNQSLTPQSINNQYVHRRNISFNDSNSSNLTICNQISSVPPSPNYSKDNSFSSNINHFNQITSFTNNDEIDFNNNLSNCSTIVYPKHKPISITNENSEENFLTSNEIQMNNDCNRIFLEKQNHQNASKMFLSSQNKAINKTCTTVLNNNRSLNRVRHSSGPGHPYGSMIYNNNFISNSNINNLRSNSLSPLYENCVDFNLEQKNDYNRQVDSNLFKFSFDKNFIGNNQAQSNNLLNDRKEHTITLQNQKFNADDKEKSVFSNLETTKLSSNKKENSDCLFLKSSSNESIVCQNRTNRARHVSSPYIGSLICNNNLNFTINDQPVSSINQPSNEFNNEVFIQNNTLNQNLIDNPTNNINNLQENFVSTVNYIDTNSKNFKFSSSSPNNEEKIFVKQKTDVNFIDKTIIGCANKNEIISSNQNEWSNLPLIMNLELQNNDLNSRNDVIANQDFNLTNSNNILERPLSETVLDDLQTTFQDLKDCDKDFSKFVSQQLDDQLKGN